MTRISVNEMKTWLNIKLKVTGVSYITTLAVQEETILNLPNTWMM